MLEPRSASILFRLARFKLYRAGVRRHMDPISRIHLNIIRPQWPGSPRCDCSGATRSSGAQISPPSPVCKCLSSNLGDVPFTEQRLFLPLTDLVAHLFYIRQLGTILELDTRMAFKHRHERSCRTLQRTIYLIHYRPYHGNADRLVVSVVRVATATPAANQPLPQRRKSLLRLRTISVMPRRIRTNQMPPACSVFSAIYVGTVLRAGNQSHRLCRNTAQASFVRFNGIKPPFTLAPVSIGWTRGGDNLFHVTWRLDSL